jgi:hypothetical protein
MISKPKVGTLVDKDRPAYKCDKCGQVWFPNQPPNRRNYSGYRNCPNGCLEIEEES